MSPGSSQEVCLLVTQPPFAGTGLSSAGNQRSRAAPRRRSPVSRTPDQDRRSYGRPTPTPVPQIVMSAHPSVEAGRGHARQGPGSL